MFAAVESARVASSCAKVERLPVNLCHIIEQTHKVTHERFLQHLQQKTIPIAFQLVVEGVEKLLVYRSAPFQRILTSLMRVGSSL